MRIAGQVYRDTRWSELDPRAAEAAHESIFYRETVDWSALSNGLPQSVPPRDGSRGWIASALSWLASCFVEGFAAYGLAMAPGIVHASTSADYEPLEQKAQSPGYGRDEQRIVVFRLAETDRWSRGDLARSAAEQNPSPIRPMSPIARFWSQVRRDWEARRTVASLSRLDDQTLRDIGLHRSQVESAARHRDLYGL